MSLGSGPHAIINTNSGNALTVSNGSDPRAITGSQYNGTENQKFYLVDLGSDIWEIRTVCAEEFVGVLGDPEQKSKIFAVPTATEWRILPSGIKYNEYNIFLQYTSGLTITLANNGIPAPVAPVQLEIIGTEYENQAWEIRRLSSD